MRSAGCIFNDIVDKDFDKIRVPYDRQAANLVKQGKM